MIRIKEAIIVEGRYDKAKLSSIVDTVIVDTGGFRIYNDKEKLKYICDLARSRGIVIMTDSDAAGFQIRALLSSHIPKSQIKQVYLPDVYGKEKRKAVPSKEGKLGVEGMEKRLIEQALINAGLTDLGPKPKAEGKMTMADLYMLGLTGGPHSSVLRKKLLKSLELPERMNIKAMLDAINSRFGYREIQEMLEAIKEAEAKEGELHGTQQDGN